MSDLVWKDVSDQYPEKAEKFVFLEANEDDFRIHIFPNGDVTLDVQIGRSGLSVEQYKTMAQAIANAANLYPVIE